MTAAVYTLSVTEQDIKTMNMLVFTLNRLHEYEAEVEDLEDGLSAVLEVSVEKAHALIGKFYQAVWEDEME